MFQLFFFPFAPFHLTVVMPGFYTTLATGAISLLSIVGLYMLFTGTGEAFNVGKLLEDTSPYAWASTGMGLCIGLSVAGAAW